MPSSSTPPPGSPGALSGAAENRLVVDCLPRGAGLDRDARARRRADRAARREAAEEAAEEAEARAQRVRDEVQTWLEEHAGALVLDWWVRMEAMEERAREILAREAARRAAEEALYGERPERTRARAAEHAGCGGVLRRQPFMEGPGNRDETGRPPPVVRRSRGRSFAIHEDSGEEDRPVRPRPGPSDRFGNPEDDQEN